MRPSGELTSGVRPPALTCGASSSNGAGFFGGAVFGGASSPVNLWGCVLQWCGLLGRAVFGGAPFASVDFVVAAVSRAVFSGAGFFSEDVDRGAPSPVSQQGATSNASSNGAGFFGGVGFFSGAAQSLGVRPHLLTCGGRLLTRPTCVQVSSAERSIGYALVRGPATLFLPPRLSICLLF